MPWIASIFTKYGKEFTLPPREDIMYDIEGEGKFKV